MGYVMGCVERPCRGSKYCAKHQLPADLDLSDISVPEIVEHRQRMSGSGVWLQYKVKDGDWTNADDLPLASVRGYELRCLPSISAQAEARSKESCSKDPRRGTGESYISRKSGGLLVAVYPCLHIVGCVPMYSSESLTQVLLFVWYVLSYLKGVKWVLYDFACGMLRFLRAQRTRRQGVVLHAWDTLLALNWRVDKLHFCKGHTACKNEESPYYEPDVNPFVAVLSV